MDNKDKDVKSALDELFESDFIEIDVNEKETNANNIINDDLFDDIINNALEKKDEIVSNDTQINNDKKKLDNNISDRKEFVPNYITTINVKKDIENKKPNKINKLYIFPIIGFIMIIILLFIYMYFIKESDVKCELKANDKGYKFSDTYIISHKGNKIISFTSTYKYTVLTEDYKEQIKYIKDEKIPVILNSNGLPGFTYVYESTDEYFNINGYIDFSKIEFNKIDKLNQDLIPISYYKINSKLTYRKFKKTLEKEGYICTNTK